MNDLIDTFYLNFASLNAEGMVQCYHPDIVFEDPAFGHLHGERAKNMWRMLCESQKGKDFSVRYDSIATHGKMGSVQWEAFYTFSKTGRRVHNVIQAEFYFKDGLIFRHRDSFNLHRWAGQALGLTGTLIGWTGFFRKKLQLQTNQLLTAFEKSRSASGA